MDIIKIEELHIFAYHGVHDFEKEDGQNFYINATLGCDTSKAGRTDDLNDTVSYSDVAKLIKRVFTEKKYDLIEAAAEHLAEEILITFPKVCEVTLEIRKPEAPIGLDIKSVSVQITRRWHKIYLGMGSNMGDKQGYLDQAYELLQESRVIRPKQMSTVISTAPYGGVEQDDFLNAVMEADTILSPDQLLEALHEIERYCHRERIVHWGPRTLDLDILLYDDLILDTEKLTIPHVDMANRRFVLEPLAEIAPHLIHPVERISIAHMLEALD